MKKLSFFILLFSYSINAAVISITSPEQFDKELSEGMPVIVDFYTDWCGPCKIMKPLFENVSEQHSDIKFLSVNGDHVKPLIKKYQVQGYPTFLFINNKGKVVLSESGAGNSPSFFDMGIQKIKVAGTQQPTVKPETHPQPLRPQQQKTGSLVKNIKTTQDFCAYVVNSPIPVFIHFYMPDCASCNDIERAFNQLTEKFGEQARFVRIKVDEENLPLLSKRAGVFSLPSYSWLITEKSMNKKFSDKDYTHLHNNINYLLGNDQKMNTHKTKKLFKHKK